MKWIVNITALVAAIAMLASPAKAETYPARPVTIVVPFAAGGGSDLLARLSRSTWKSASASLSSSRTGREPRPASPR